MEGPGGGGPEQLLQQMGEGLMMAMEAYSQLMEGAGMGDAGGGPGGGPGGPPPGGDPGGMPA